MALHFEAQRHSFDRNFNHQQNIMDYRNEAFKKKFSDAARHLGVEPDRIVSMKFRENVGSYSEYHELLRVLEREFGIKWQAIDADLQGKGYLLSDGTARVLMVEHETGLEILYIAGSIASLIGLVPLLLQGWRGLRGWSTGRHHDGIRGVEIRRLDENGQLTEDHIHDMPTLTGIPSKVLVSAAKMVENDLHQAMDKIQSLVQRMETLENRIASKTKKSKATNLKKGALRKNTKTKPR